MEQKKKRWYVKIEDFSFVGIVSFLVQFIITVFLTETLKSPYYISFGLGIIISSIINFFLNKKYTFGFHSNIAKSIDRFIVLEVFNVIFNWAAVILFVEVFHINYMASIIIIAIILSAVNFVTEDFWVFREDKEVLAEKGFRH